MADSPQVILGGFGDQFQAFNPGGLLGTEDAMAALELESFFRKLGFHRTSIVFADRHDPERLRGENLILIGGPDANSITAEIARRVRSTLKLGDSSKHPISIFDSREHRTYAPKVAPDSHRVVTDYGVIMKTANPFAREKLVLVLAGSYGSGTWAAARLATSESFPESADPGLGEGVRGTTLGGRREKDSANTKTRAASCP